MDTLLRAYSTFEVKSSDAERGLIHGWASTPDVDSVGDVMEPMGAVFDLPLPLLHEHDRKSPIGTVIAAKATPDGIQITAKVALGVTSKIDEIFALLKAGLIRGLSIGFRGIDSEPIRSTGGRRYKSWKFMELSAVVMPANSAAGILAVKRADHEVLSRLGLMGKAPDLNAPDDMSVLQLLAKMGTDRCIVENRDGALVVELLDKAKSAALQGSRSDRKYINDVLLEFTKGLGQRVAGRKALEALAARVKALEGK